MKTVDDLVAKMESAIPVGESTDRRLSVTGEPYVVHAFFARNVGKSNYLSLMLKKLYQEFEQQIIPNKSVLYWRIKPEYTIQGITDYGTGKRREELKVWMRYLVSPRNL